jgi:hypothetical protein
VSKIELGRIGAVVNPGDGRAFIDTAIELENLGYATIWITGGPLENLGQIADVIRATNEVRVATGIISVDRFDVEEVARLYRDIEATNPGRFHRRTRGRPRTETHGNLDLVPRPTRCGAEDGTCLGRARTADA